MKGAVKRQNLTAIIISFLVCIQSTRLKAEVANPIQVEMTAHATIDFLRQLSSNEALLNVVNDPIKIIFGGATMGGASATGRTLLFGNLWVAAVVVVVGGTGYILSDIHERGEEKKAKWRALDPKEVLQAFEDCRSGKRVCQYGPQRDGTFISYIPKSSVFGTYAGPRSDEDRERKRKQDEMDFDSGKALGIIPEHIKNAQQWVLEGRLTRRSSLKTGESTDKSEELEFISRGEIGIAFLHEPSGLVVKVILNPGQKRIMFDYDLDENGKTIKETEIQATARQFTLSEELAGRILSKMIQDKTLPEGIHVTPLRIIEDAEIMIGVKPYIEGSTLLNYWNSITHYGPPTSLPSQGFKLWETLRGVRPFRAFTLENTYLVEDGINMIDSEIMGEHGHLITSIMDLRRARLVDEALAEAVSVPFLNELEKTPHPVLISPELIQKIRYLVHQMLRSGELSLYQ